MFVWATTPQSQHHTTNTVHGLVLQGWDVLKPCTNTMVTTQYHQYLAWPCIARVRCAQTPHQYHGNYTIPSIPCMALYYKGEMCSNPHQYHGNYTIPSYLAWPCIARVRCAQTRTNTMVTTQYHQYLAWPCIARVRCAQTRTNTMVTTQYHQYLAWPCIARVRCAQTRVVPHPKKLTAFSAWTYGSSSPWPFHPPALQRQQQLPHLLHHHHHHHAFYIATQEVEWGKGVSINNK